MLKEVRMRPKIGQHDFEAKARVVQRQLDGGDKVKLTIMFRGRENTHPELGVRLLKKMTDLLGEMAQIEGHPAKIGSRMHIILLPKTLKVPVKEGVVATDAKA
jgi:translation initiation factor IF-3